MHQAESTPALTSRASKPRNFNGRSIFRGSTVVTAAETFYGKSPCLNMSEPQPQLNRITGGVTGISPKQLAMFVLFGTLSMLFGASVVGYLITRAQNDVWKTASMPNLPLGLVASSILLLALSIAMHRALAAVRQNRFEATQRAALDRAAAGHRVRGRPGAELALDDPARRPASDARHPVRFYLLHADRTPRAARLWAASCRC